MNNQKWVPKHIIKEVIEYHVDESLIEKKGQWGKILQSKLR